MLAISARLTVPVLLMATAMLSSTNAVNAQTPGQEARGPRFLVASSNSLARAVPVDVSRTPVLRQRIGLQLDGVTLKQALAAIAQQAGLTLAYAEDVVPLQSRITLRADGITVAAALTDVLVDANVDVVFMPGGRVVLRKRVGAIPLRAGMLLGQISNAKTGEPLARAEAFLEGTSWRATSDTAGWYRLSDVDAGVYTLTARLPGYAKQSRQVTVDAEGVDTINLALDPVATKLEDLVTTATGQQRRRDLGNAITTINADSVLQTAPIRSLTDLLEDRVPGATVRHTSGAPGDPARVRLRGISSVLRSNDPVVIVDGIRVYAAQAEARSGNLAAIAAGSMLQSNIAAPSPLDQIDPNIIEKIEVFKGPSAATLYGADAANGVIVITTKKGQPGPTRWTAQVSHGRTYSIGRYPEGHFLWGHSQFENTQRLCLGLANISRYCPEQDSLVRFQALNDPALTPLGRGNRTAISLAASGGNQALTYSITGSYDDETGLLQLPPYEAERFRARFHREAPDWMRRPHQLKRWSVSSNVRALLSSAADVTLSTTLSRSEQERTELERRVAPLAGVYMDTLNGRYYTISRAMLSGAELSADFLGDYYRRATASAINFTTGLNASWRPKSWLDVNANAGINVIPRADEQFLPAGLIAATDSGALARGSGRSLVSTLALRGNISRPVGREFTFQTSVGFDLNTTATNDLLTTATGLQPGTGTIGGAETITAQDREVSTSVFGWYIEPRIVGRRIAISTGLRLDGGSANGGRVTASRGIGSLLGLPKLNGSWVISEEPWFPLASLFQSLRLRGAYGQAQVQPGPADRLRLYRYTTPVTNSDVELTSVGNVDLRPERSKELEGGFDADMLDGRLSLEFTAYRKTKFDALMTTTLPQSVNGGGIFVQNIGDVQNTGLEVVLGLTPVQSSALTWHTQLIYSRDKNVLVKLGHGVLPDPDEGIVEGYPLNSRWERPILGYGDENEDGVIQPEEVLVGDSLAYVGQLFPEYSMSFFSNASLFGGAVGISAGFSYDHGSTQLDSPLESQASLVRGFVDPTAPLEEQAAVIVSTGNNFAGGSLETSYGLIQRVSTFRFQSLAVKYRAPSQVARLFRAQQLDVMIQGSNLGVHSSYRGRDPDVSAWQPGESFVDGGALALPRTWQLALSLRY